MKGKDDLSPKHAWVDYTLAVLLVAISFFIPAGQPSGKLLLVSGLGLLISGVFTNYPGGFVPILDRKRHLAMDTFVAVSLTVIPLFMQGSYRVIPFLSGAAILAALAITEFKSINYFFSRRRVGPPSR